MGKLGKPEKATDKKKTEDDEIDFPLEEISPAMYRKKKIRKEKEKCLLKRYQKVTHLQEKNQIRE